MLFPPNHHAEDLDTWTKIRREGAVERFESVRVAKDGTPIDTAALLAVCAEKMPRYMVPKFIEVLTELPRTSSGKVDYPALRRKEGL
jgi:acyl-CoA synthetase (AMP-forming)/AMP-acid ligase II